MEKLRKLIFRNYLDDGERILDIAHRHIIIFKIDAAKISALGLFLPLLIYVLFPVDRVQTVAIIWGILGICAMFYKFSDWYFDVWLITNHGVISIHRDGLFDVKAQRVDWYMITDVSYTIHGVLQTLLGYGDIMIDRMSASVVMTLKDAAAPKKLERKLAKYRDKFVHEKSLRDHHDLKNMLSEMIAYHANNEKISVPKKKS